MGFNQGCSDHDGSLVGSHRLVRSDLCSVDQLDYPLMSKQWYVVHTLTGQEEKVKTSLQRVIESRACADAIVQVLVPMEKVSEVKAG